MEDIKKVGFDFPPKVPLTTRNRTDKIELTPIIQECGALAST